MPYLAEVSAHPNENLWAPWSECWRYPGGATRPTRLQAAQRRLAFALTLQPGATISLVADVITAVCELVVGTEDGIAGLMQHAGLRPEHVDAVTQFLRRPGAVTYCEQEMHADEAVRSRRRVEKLADMAADPGPPLYPLPRLVAQMRLDAPSAQRLRATLARVPTTQQLVRAAGAGEAHEVRRLIQAAADPNAADEYGKTPLRWAAQQDEVETVTALVEGGADVDKAGEPWLRSSPDGMTPLMVAAYYGRSKAVRRLLALGADANAQGIGWVSPQATLSSALELAEHNGQEATAHILRDWSKAFPAPGSDDDA